MNNMNRTKFITGLGLSSILTACGGGASGGGALIPGTKPTPPSTMPPTAAPSQIQTQMQSLSSSSDMLAFESSFATWATSTSLAYVANELVTSPDIRLTATQSSMISAFKAMTASPDLLTSILNGTALTATQQTKIAAINQNLQGNAFVQKINALATTNTISAANINQIIANTTSAKDYIKASPQSSGDVYLDAVLSGAGTIITGSSFRNLASNAIPIMQTTGFAAWAQSQQPLLRSAILFSSSPLTTISTLSIRSKQSMGIPTPASALNYMAQVTGAISLVFLCLAAVGLVISAPGVIAATIVGLAFGLLSFWIAGNIQQTNWDHGIDIVPPPPATCTPDNDIDEVGEIPANCD
jgi:hypothetical protein